MAQNVDNLAKWVGLIGGGLGIVAAVAGGVAVVIAYFATRTELTRVDCYQYYSISSLSEQSKQTTLLNEYLNLNRKAAEAEVAKNKDPYSADLIAKFNDAVRLQNEKLEELEGAQKKSKEALENLNKCGHQGPGK